jgi:hypothetical protein
MTRRYDLNECHEAVTDADGILEPCNHDAIGWRVDPGENQPYPVCVLHHRWPYADAWVSAHNTLHDVRRLVDDPDDVQEWETLDGTVQQVRVIAADRLLVTIDGTNGEPGCLI